MNQPQQLPPALVFALNKPAGPTSFDVVHTVKKLLGKKFARKIGHFGTLDPFADGLILIGTGGATRLADRFHEEFPKTYRAIGKLGVQMDTGDSTGDEVARAPVEKKSLEEWHELAQSMIGEYWQRPPAFSATKHEGKALYEYARRGIMIEKEPVRREIYQFEVLAVTDETVEFRAQVSSGTYIRTLFEDLAKGRNNLGHLTHLTREKIGELSCPKPHEGLKQWTRETLETHWLAFDQLLQLPSIELSGRDLELFSNGQCLTREPYKAITGEVWVHNPTGELMALGKVEDGVLKSSVMFPGGAPSTILDKSQVLKLGEKLGLS